MSDAVRPFKVLCPHAECQKPFHVRFALGRPVAGTGEVVVTCQYCSKQVVIEIPRSYIAEDALIRGIPGRAVEG